MQRKVARIVQLPLKAYDAEKQINARAANSKMVLRTQHLVEMMLERDITMRQVLSTLRRGQVVSGPEWSEDHNNWTYKVQKLSSGRDVTVVCCLSATELTVTAITTYGRGGG